MSVPENIKLVWSEFQKSTSSFLSCLRESNDFTDVTLLCEDSDLLQAHRVVLSAGSSFFENVFKAAGASPHPFLYLRGVSRVEMEAVVNFLYRGETSVPRQQLDSFLALARDLGVRGFAEGGNTSNYLATSQIKDINLDLKSEIFCSPPTFSPRKDLAIENHDNYSEKGLYEANKLSSEEEKSSLKNTEKSHVEISEKIINENYDIDFLENSIPAWEGKKLFPPRKLTCSSSRAWKFGGFRMTEEGNLDLSLLVCGMCGAEFKYIHSSFSLNDHMKRKHEKDYYKNWSEEENYKQTLVFWKDEQLFPPSKHAKSKAWQFGGFRMNEQNQLDLSVSVCSLCGLEQNFRGSPTNLHQHIMSRHKKEWESGDPENDPPILTNCLSGKTDPELDPITIPCGDISDNHEIKNKTGEINDDSPVSQKKTKYNDIIAKIPKEKNDDYKSMKKSNKINYIQSIADDMTLLLEGSKWQCKVCAKLTDSKEAMQRHVKKKHFMKPV